MLVSLITRRDSHAAKLSLSEFGQPDCLSGVRGRLDDETPGSIDTPEADDRPNSADLWRPSAATESQM